MKEQNRRITIHDVLFVSKLHANLLLVIKLVARELKMHFNIIPRCIVMAQDGVILAMDSMETNLYHFEFKKVNGVK